MARSRSIRPEFWDDEKLARVSRDTRLLFIGLWKCSDDYGVTKGNAIWLRSQIFPYDDITLSEFVGWLNELEKLECIIPFKENGENYYYIRTFTKYQKLDHPSQQRNPKPPHALAKLSRVARESSSKGVLQTETETETETETPPSRRGALDPIAETFQKALSITNEKLSLTTERRRVLVDVLNNKDIGIPNFMLAVKNLAGSSWPTKSITYFIDNKFEAVNRVDRFANAPPVDGGNSPPKKTVMEAPPELKAIFNRTKRANTTT
jgi:hypothetical protein